MMPEQPPHEDPRSEAENAVPGGGQLIAAVRFGGVRHGASSIGRNLRRHASAEWVCARIASLWVSLLWLRVATGETISRRPAQQQPLVSSAGAQQSEASVVAS